MLCLAQPSTTWRRGGETNWSGKYMEAPPQPSRTFRLPERFRHRNRPVPSIMCRAAKQQTLSYQYLCTFNTAQWTTYCIIIWTRYSREKASSSQQSICFLYFSFVALEKDRGGGGRGVHSQTKENNHNQSFLHTKRQPKHYPKIFSSTIAATKRKSKAAQKINNIALSKNSFPLFFSLKPPTFSAPPI